MPSRTPAHDDRPGVSLSALVAAVTGGMVAVLYVWVIVHQEGDTWHDALRFGALLGVAVTASLVAAFVPNEPVRLGLAAAASAVFVSGVILGALSIGGLLLPAAIASLLCLSSTGARVGPHATWLAAGSMGIAAVAVIALYAF